MNAAAQQAWGQWLAATGTVLVSGAAVAVFVVSVKVADMAAVRDAAVQTARVETTVARVTVAENQVGTGLERVAEGTERISFGGVAPGKYRLLVTDMPNPWPVLQRPDLLKSLESHTQAVEVTEGGKLSLTAEIVSRDELKKALEDKE